MLSWQLVKEILEEHDQNIQNETNSEVEDEDVEVEIAEGDQADDEDVEVEVAEGDQTNDEDVEMQVAEGDQANDEEVEVEVAEGDQADDSDWDDIILTDRSKLTNSSQCKSFGWCFYVTVHNSRGQTQHRFAEISRAIVLRTV